MNTVPHFQGVRQPYPGLRPFLQSESDLFFGRADQINRMLGCMGASHFLAVVGGSGSGKSSLVRAGLLPALQEGYLLDAGTDWKFVVMRPAGDPFGNLAAEFHRTIEGTGGDPDPSDVAFTRATLKTSPRGFLEVIAEANLEKSAPILLLVDQFEEIFRFRRRNSTKGSVGDEGKELRKERNDATAFANLLLATAEFAQEAGLPIYVLITMRSDFMGDCDVFPGLPQAVSNSQFLVPRLTRRQIQEAIEKPLILFDCQAEPGLVNQMLNDAGTDPDQLPLMQHALMRTWFAAETRWSQGAAENVATPVEHVLTLADYGAAGHFSGALSQHLEEAWASLKTDRSRQIAQQLFLCLSERSGEGALIRRMAKIREIADVTGAPVAEVNEVVKVFRDRSNFIMASPGPLGDDSVLDISHEALLRQWPRLASWLEEESKSAETYIRLADNAARWKAEEAELVHGRELEQLQDWIEERKPTKVWAERYHRGPFDMAMEFLTQSKAAANRQRANRMLKRSWRPWGLFMLGVAGAAFIWAIATGKFSEFSKLEEMTAAAHRIAQQIPGTATGNADELALVKAWSIAALKMAGAVSLFGAISFSAKRAYLKFSFPRALRAAEIAALEEKRVRKPIADPLGNPKLGYAGFGRRACAHSIDLFLQVAAFFGLASKKWTLIQAALMFSVCCVSNTTGET